MSWTNHAPTPEKGLKSLRKKHTAYVKKLFTFEGAHTLFRMFEAGTPARDVLVFVFKSKLREFKGLDFRVWLQLESGAVLTQDFTYYTLEALASGKQHRDAVSVPPGIRGSHGKLVRYRVEFEYEGILAMEHMGGARGAKGWWQKRATEQAWFWNAHDNPRAEVSSRTLGKLGLEQKR